MLLLVLQYGNTVRLLLLLPSWQSESYHQQQIYADNIWQLLKFCALNELQADIARVYEGNFFVKYVGTMLIPSWQSESYHQQQIYADNIWQLLKFGTNRLSYFTCTATNRCLGALSLSFFIWNHTVDPNNADGDYSPYTLATGCLVVIRPLLCFGFNDEQMFPLESKEIYIQKFFYQYTEICGRCVGISEKVDASMTWKILTDKTQKIIYCYDICSALDPKSFSPSAKPSVPPVPILDPAKVVFLRNHGESDDSTSDQNGSSAPFQKKYNSLMKDKNGNDRRNRKCNLVYKTGLPTHLTIGKLIDDYDQALQKGRTRQAHFEIKFTTNEKDDIMSYNDIVNYMNCDSALYDGEYWNYRNIITHKATPRIHPNYKGSSYNLRILWENGEHSDEPLKVFGKDAPVDCAVYAKKHGLLDIDKPEGRWFKRIAKRKALLVRLVKQARLQSFCTSPKYHR